MVYFWGQQTITDWPCYCVWVNHTAVLITFSTSTEQTQNRSLTNCVCCQDEISWVTQKWHTVWNVSGRFSYNKHVKRNGFSEWWFLTDFNCKIHFKYIYSQIYHEFMLYISFKQYISKPMVVFLRIKIVKLQNYSYWFWDWPSPTLCADVPLRFITTDCNASEVTL